MEPRTLIIVIFTVTITIASSYNRTNYLLYQLFHWQHHDDHIHPKSGAHVLHNLSRTSSFEDSRGLFQQINWQSLDNLGPVDSWSLKCVNLSGTSSFEDFTFKDFSLKTAFMQPLCNICTCILTTATHISGSKSIFTKKVTFGAEMPCDHWEGKLKLLNEIKYTRKAKGVTKLWTICNFLGDNFENFDNIFLIFFDNFGWYFTIYYHNIQSNIFYIFDNFW